jgi:hypothetical protein
MTYTRVERSGERELHLIQTPKMLLISLVVSCVALAHCDKSLRQAEPSQQSKITTQAVTPPKAEEEQVKLDSIELDDLEMRPLATRAITGDLRPFYLVKGRIQNSTGKTLRSVRIRIYVKSAGSPNAASQEYFDEADVHVDGPIHDGTRGFSQQIQVLPPAGKRWTFKARVIDATVDPKAE